MSEKIIQLNEEAVKTELKDLVRKSVEETLNELDKVHYFSQKENRVKNIDMSPHFW